MRQDHRDRETGEVEEVELYVAVVGASNFTYVEATRTQQLADFVMSTSSSRPGATVTTLS